MQTKKMMNNMIEIKEGPELNIAIAKKIGIKHFQYEDNERVFVLEEELNELLGHEFRVKGVMSYYRFQPDVNIDDAIKAASVLSDYFALLKDDLTEGQWECKLLNSDNPLNEWKNWNKAKTPALAICSAILKFKGE